jgi:hypothetical protein
VSVAGYLNTMQSAINTGVGSGNDITTAYSSEIAIASDVNALADRMNLLLLYGQISSGLRARVINAVGAIAIPGGTATPAQIAAAQLNRVKLAIYMVMASPEYLAQR